MTFQVCIALLRSQLGYGSEPEDLYEKYLEEAVELAESLAHGNPANILEEAGDVLCVLAAILNAHGLSMEQAQEAVIAKLEARRDGTQKG